MKKTEQYFLGAADALTLPTALVALWYVARTLGLIDGGIRELTLSLALGLAGSLVIGGGLWLVRAYREVGQEIDNG